MKPEIIDTAIEAAVEAGKKILEIYYHSEADFSIEKKADNSPLTIADKASHNTIEELLEKTKIPILSEEGRNIPYDERKKWKTFWLVDPLDGTKEFIKQNGEFTVNIALIEEGKPILGIIYVPVAKTLYTGITGEGAWKMEHTDDVLSVDTLKKRGTKLTGKSLNDKYRVVGSRSHMSEETQLHIKKLQDKHPKIEIVSKGSSLKICMVAEGTADEYPRFGLTMEWDTAAGHAIANAAGKHLWLTDFSGELKYNKENLLNPYFIVR